MNIPGYIRLLNQWHGPIACDDYDAYIRNIGGTFVQKFVPMDRPSPDPKLPEVGWSLFSTTKPYKRARANGCLLLAERIIASKKHYPRDLLHPNFLELDSNGSFWIHANAFFIDTSADSAGLYSIEALYEWAILVNEGRNFLPLLFGGIRCLKYQTTDGRWFVLHGQ